jgi:hypothetical protein
MPITKATQSVITPNIVTTDTRQTITGEKVIVCLYDTTSTTSLTIGTGSKTLTVGTGLTWVAGRDATIRNGTSTTRFMTGSVTSYDSVTGVMVVNITTVGSGTGTYTSWVVTQSSTTALPALRITSNDTGANAFVVEDSTNPDSTPLVITNSGALAIGATSMPSNMTFVKQYVNGGTNGNWQQLSRTATNSAVYGILNYGAINGIDVTSGEMNWRKSSNIFISNLDPVLNIDIISEFDSLTANLFNGIIQDSGQSILFEVRVLVNIVQTNLTTGGQVWQRGAYSGNVVVGVYASNNWLASDFIGYTANSLSTTQPGTGTTSQVNFTTAAGIAPTLGGAPATGFASLIAVRETASTNGSLTLQIRPHTTANTASLQYGSNIGIHLKMLTI